MAKKLKVAIQFYGHLRTFENTYSSLKENLLNLYDCDIFIHTWDELQHRTKTWYDQGNEHIKVTQEYKDKIKEYYNPKSLLIETQEIPAKDTILQSHIIEDAIVSLTGVKYLFYSQYKANELRKKFEQEHNIEYDYIIVIRPDVELYKPLKINAFVSQYNFINQISGNTITDNVRFCPHNKDAHSEVNILIRAMCASDILYFGSPNVINQTCNFYLKIKDDNKFLIDNFSNPEGLVYKHNKDKNIETCLICYSSGEDWNVVRMNTKSLNNKNKFSFSRILRIKVKRSILAICFFSGILPSIFRFKIKLFNKFTFDISIGRIKN